MKIKHLVCLLFISLEKGQLETCSMDNLSIEQVD